MCVHSHPHFFGVLFWIVPSGTAFISLNSIGFLLHFTIIHSETVSSVVSVLTCQSSGFFYFYFLLNEWFSPILFLSFCCVSVSKQTSLQLGRLYICRKFSILFRGQAFANWYNFVFFEVCSMTKVHAAYLNPIFAQLCLIFGSRSSRVLS